MNFEEQLKRQLAFLQRSCQLYDAGHIDEGIRIAVTLRVLFHQTPKSTALVIGHLKWNHIKLVSTNIPNSTNSPLFAGLCTLRFELREGPRAKEETRLYFEALLNEATNRRQISFPDWWNTEVVFWLHRRDFNLTRRMLTLAAANQDGGAHVGSTLPKQYGHVNTGAGVSFKVSPDNPSEFAPFTVSPTNGHYASLRQIAYEVLDSPAFREYV